MKLIIIKSSGNELANKLWSYASIYAYSLEKGALVENPSFFEYGNYFRMPVSKLTKLFFFDRFTNYTKRKTSIKRRFWRKIYNIYSNFIIYFNKSRVIKSDNSENKPLYLPPTQKNEWLESMSQKSSKIYFDGWLFRNPGGLTKYRKEIVEYFKPVVEIENSYKSKIKELREKYKILIGLHIRQGDYKTWRNGDYFIEQKRVVEIANEYLKNNNLNNKDVCFVITSDGEIDGSLFSNLNTFISRENAIYDLFLLSLCDAIIGSNSTFGAFSSYYGDIPFIIMQKGSMDWEYYKNKKKFFNNQYSTFVHY